MSRKATSLLSALQGLRLSPTIPLRPATTPSAICMAATTQGQRPHVRTFTATAANAGSWLEPQIDRKKKMMKGRPRVPTGGSSKGTTVMVGDYGLRMWDHHRRISAQQLKVAEDTIKQRLRGQRYRLYKRVNCNIGVYVSGNEVSLSRHYSGSI